MCKYLVVANPDLGKSGFVRASSPAVFAHKLDDVPALEPARDLHREPDARERLLPVHGRVFRDEDAGETVLPAADSNGHGCPRQSPSLHQQLNGVAGVHPEPGRHRGHNPVLSLRPLQVPEEVQHYQVHSVSDS